MLTSLWSSGRKESVAMKNMMRGIGWMAVFGSKVAYAALADETNEMSLLVYLFLAVIALIIGTQVIPAGVLFYNTIKSLFWARVEKDADEKEVG
jgi:uncharacterized membrane protein